MTSRARLRLIALPSLLVTSAALGDTTCTWIGGASGLWNNAAAWSPNTVPNNNGAFLYSAVVDGRGGSPSTAVMNLSVALQTLSITSGDEVFMNVGQTLSLAGGFLTNDGKLTLNATGNVCDVRLMVDTDFDGNGAVVGSNITANRIYGANNQIRLTNKLGHTIRGGMQLGSNGLVISNAGVIQADTPSGMVIDATDGPTNLNIGVIRATGGSTMTVASSRYQNTDGSTDGVFEADGGSLVAFIGSVTIGGGILRDVDGAGPGAVRSVNTLTLTDITIEGGLELANNSLTGFEGTMTLNGPVTMGSTGGATDLVLRTSPLSLSGSSARIDASDSTANRIYGVNNTVRLVVPANGYIHGGLQIGANGLNLTNYGLIEADSAAGIALDLTDGGTQFNAGTLRATNGATLKLQPAASFDNTGGVIEAGAGSTVTLNVVTLTGGTLRDADGSGPGEVRNISTVTLKDLTIEGPFRANPGTATSLTGSIAFNGPISLGSDGATTDLVILTSPFVLGGTSATVSASNFQANRIYSPSNQTRLIVPANATIHGGLQLGANTLLLTNSGLIEADSSAGMTIDLTDGTPGHFNSGTFRSSNGATLTIQAANIDNTGGLIEAGAGSFVALSNLGLVGGTVRDADGPGAGGVQCSGTIGLDGVTLQGTVNAANGTAVNLRNSIDIQGTLGINSTGGTTDLIALTSSFTLAGAGQTVFSNATANRFYSNAPDHVISVGATHTVRGSVQWCINGSSLINLGTIVADSSAGMTFDPVDSGQFRNDGTLRVSGGNVSIVTGPFQNTGTVQVDAGRTLARTGVYLQTAGLTRIDGSLSASGGVSVVGGVLGGTGQVGASVSNSAGTVAPGNSVGILALNQGYTQGALGTLRAEIGGAGPGTGHDQLAVLGNVSLSGTLEVARVTGFEPARGESFVVLTWTGSRTGTFANLTGCDQFTVTYNANSVTVQFVGTPGGVGDVNNDGSVDGADLGALLGQWGACVGPCCPADVNGDGVVDGADLGALLGAWS